MILGVAAAAGVAWVAYSILHTISHIPEAYAAWDTGTLLIAYMKSHEDRWPQSWDDLLTVLEDEKSEIRKEIFLGGTSHEHNRELEYARSLKNMVKLDWSYDPSKGGTGTPVTRPDGTRFPVVWEGAEPNEMVRDYMIHHPRGK
jgi:hypothetical protein